MSSEAAHLWTKDVYDNLESKNWSEEPHSKAGQVESFSCNGVFLSQNESVNTNKYKYIIKHHICKNMLFL